MNTRITRADKILIAVLFLVNTWVLVLLGGGGAPGNAVLIEVNQKEVARLPLASDQVTSVQGPLGVTQVQVRDGQARILRSPCPNKVCIKSGFIRYADRLIACIPNRVVVRIVGEKQRGLDAVVG